MSGTGWMAPPQRFTVFESVARLYAADPDVESTLLLEAGAGWTVPNAEQAASRTVWGNTPAAGAGLRRAAGWAIGRERAVRRLRALHGARVRRVHRLPPALRAGPVPPIVRSTVHGGLLAELSSDDVPRVIDRVVAAAEAEAAGHVRLRPSRDGSALATLRHRGGALVEVRMAAVGMRKDPGRNADALETLHEAGRLHTVPELLGRGVIAGTSWTTETRLAGQVPPRLTRSLLAQLVAFCAALPGSEAATSLRERMQLLGERYPTWATLARQLAHGLPNVPGMVQHGDLWIGNVLTRRGRLVGVIDWDTWHPAGLPGVDLLHVVAMERRRRTGADIGALWLSGIWKDSTFVDAARPYWKAIGIPPTAERLEAIGLDWWAGQLFKRQAFAQRPGWLHQNVDRVLATFAGVS